MLQSYVNPQNPFEKTGSSLEVRGLRFETTELDSSKSLLALPHIADLKSKATTNMQLWAKHTFFLNFQRVWIIFVTGRHQSHFKGNK